MTLNVHPQSSLTFDGQYDCINFGDTDLSGVLAKGSSTFTISGWVNPDRLDLETSNHGTRNVFFARASKAHNDNLELGISPECNLDIYIDENTDNITKTFGNGELTLSQWHFFALVFNQGQITVYLEDNQYQGSFKGSSLDQAKGSPVTLGATLHDDVYFSGQIANISVWNYCCSSEEIQKYRYQPLAGNEPGLVAYWPLNEGQGTTVQDRTANGHQGTFQGQPNWEVAEVPFNIPPEPLSPILSQEQPQKSMDSTATPQYKILSIDGGGIRGIIPATILAEIEKRTQKPIFSLFDLMAGTSTGGLLALGLTKPKLDAGQPTAQYSAEDLLAMYVENGGVIFYESFFEQMLGPLEDILARPKYVSEGRDEVVSEYFGDTPLEHCLKEVFVTSYDIEQRIPVFFTSKPEKQQTESRQFRKLCQGFTLKDAAMATSAAPTYFEPYHVSTSHNNNGFYTLVDGGMVSNNPAYLAMMEAEMNERKQQKDLSPNDILLVSLGTGSLTTIYQYDDVKNWGLLQWVRPLLNIMFDGGSELVAGQLERLLEPAGVENPGLYYRFQTFLTGELEAMDNAKPENIRGLQALAKRLIEEKSEEIDQLCDLLVNGNLG